MISVAAYCRVSTDQTDQLNSFSAQQAYFRSYIQSKPDWLLHEIYADEGISGTSIKKRTEFNRMIRDAHLGRFQLILTKEVSRFSRNILDTIAYTRELKALGVAVAFVNDGINTNEPDAELRLSIMGSIAQEESRKTSARVKWGQTRQMERGVVFGRSLLGYDVQQGRLAINPEGAEIVRLIFQKYVIENKGTSVIARELQEQGFRTLTGNPCWSVSHILKILKNEKYAGDLIQKKSYTPDYLSHAKKQNRGAEPLVCIKDHHEPIIDRELWEAAQREIQRRDRHRQHGGHSSRYVFSGKIQCGLCGSSFVSRVKKQKDGTQSRYWACASATNKGSTNGCGIGRLLRNELVMDMLRASLRSLCLNDVTIANQLFRLIPYVDCTIKTEAQRLLHYEVDNDAFFKNLIDIMIVHDRSRVELRFKGIPYGFFFTLEPN